MKKNMIFYIINHMMYNRYMGLLVAGLFSIMLVGAGYFGIYLPDVGPALAIKIDVTPRRIARGAHLSKSVKPVKNIVDRFTAEVKHGK